MERLKSCALSADEIVFSPIFRSQSAKKVTSNWTTKPTSTSRQNSWALQTSMMISSL